MESKAIYQALAATFVQPKFKSHFVHEAVRDRAKLMRRIADSIGEVFPPEFLGKPAPFRDDELCILVDQQGLLGAGPWSNFALRSKETEGSLLVFNQEGSKFWAKPRGTATAVPYAGQETSMRRDD